MAERTMGDAYAGEFKLSYDEAHLNSTEKSIKDATRAINDLKEEWEDATEEHKKEIEKQIKVLQKQVTSQQALKKALDETKKALLVDLTNNLSKVMDKFLETQESMAYNLNGTGRRLQDVTDKLTTAIAGSGIVKQEQVYNNLAKLVKSGIVYNAEQRAYLQTLSDDLGMMFNAQDGYLTRLIRLQQTDLSSHRMAIEDSLHQFLNQNLQTSEYIRDGFEGVSKSLIEAQSLMSASGGMRLEATVQKWLGALSSVGMSSDTISSISSTLGSLGAGDYSALSSNTGMLLNMAAARAGLSMGEILHSGISAETAETLLSSMVSYISGMNGTSSNVVKAAYGKIFGLNVSDIAAVNNVSDDLMQAIDDTVIGDNIAELLEKTDDYVYFSRKISNVLENMMYGAATEIASSPAYYTIFKSLDLIKGLSGSILGTDSMVTNIIGGAQAVSTLPAFARVISSMSSNLGGVPGVGLPAGMDLDSGNTMNAAGYYWVEGDGVTNMGQWVYNPALAGMALEQNNSSGSALNWVSGVSALSVFKRLGGGSGINGVDSNFVGGLFGFNNQGSVSISGSGYIGGGNGLNSSATAQGTTVGADAIANKSLNDVYNLLSDAVNAIIDLPNQPFGTVARIAEAGNTVTIGNDLTYIQDLMTLSAMNIQNIYSLLVARFSGQSNANVVDTGSMNWNHPFNWMQTAIGGNA